MVTLIRAIEGEGQEWEFRMIMRHGLRGSECWPVFEEDDQKRIHSENTAPVSNVEIIQKLVSIKMWEDPRKGRIGGSEKQSLNEFPKELVQVDKLQLTGQS